MDCIVDSGGGWTKVFSKGTGTLQLVKLVDEEAQRLVRIVFVADMAASRVLRMVGCTT